MTWATASNESVKVTPNARLDNLNAFGASGMVRKVSDLSPAAATKALKRLKTRLSAYSDSEASDRLVNILARCIYDRGRGVLWALDMPIVKVILRHRPVLVKYLRNEWPI